MEKTEKRILYETDLRNSKLNRELRKLIDKDINLKKIINNLFN